MCMGQLARLEDMVPERASQRSKHQLHPVPRKQTLL